MSQIRHISTTTVRPENQNDQRIQLTPMDLRLIQYDYIQKGLLFRKPTDLKKSKNLLQNLKSTLSQTLNLFYPLAGRLSVEENEDNTTCFFLNCTGEGAHFVHAVADGVKVADILDAVFIPDHIVNGFFSLEGFNYEGVSKPLLAAQVTELVDGVFIGCCMNHMVADGTSFWHFFNTWSEISRLDKISQPRPVCSRSFFDNVVDLPIRLPISFLNEVKNITVENSPPLNSFQRVVFHFSKERVRNLKSKANAEINTVENNITISSLQAVMAHLWRGITRGRDLNADKEITYRIVVGLRQRLDPPLLKEYLGSATLCVTVRCTAGDLLQNGLGWTASRINKTIGALKSEQARKFMEDWVKAPQCDPTNVELFTGSSPRFDVYGNDFGWGRPVAVRSGIQDRKMGRLTVFPGYEEGSIDFQACLSPETVRAMANDAEFVEALGSHDEPYVIQVFEGRSSSEMPNINCRDSLASP